MQRDARPLPPIASVCRCCALARRPVHGRLAWRWGVGPSRRCCRRQRRLVPQPRHGSRAGVRRAVRTGRPEVGRRPCGARFRRTGAAAPRHARADLHRGLLGRCAVRSVGRRLRGRRLRCSGADQLRLAVPAQWADHAGRMNSRDRLFGRGLAQFERRGCRARDRAHSRMRSSTGCQGRSSAAPANQPDPRDSRSCQCAGSRCRCRTACTRTSSLPMEK